ncbi:hypothetical protein ACF1BQ_030600 [Bradyrhizobium sp. RDT10]
MTKDNFLDFRKLLSLPYNCARAADRVSWKSEIISLDACGKLVHAAAISRVPIQPVSRRRCSARHAKSYGNLETATINMVRPGIGAEEPFFCTEQAKKLGLNFKVVPDDPAWRKGEAGSWHGFQHRADGHRIWGRDVYHLKDLFVVTDQGPRLLSSGFATPARSWSIGQPIRT